MVDGHEAAKNVADVAAGGAAIVALFQYLPNVAAAVALIWTLIRIYEWAEQRYGFGRGRKADPNK